MTILLEVLLELVLPLVTEILADLFLHRLDRFVRAHTALRIVVTALMYFGVGLGSGFGSLLIFPKALAHSSAVPGISLVITPILGGLLLSFIAWVRVPGWDWTIRLETFAYGYLFAFAMTLVRLLFTM
jgi:hypothetical protein